MNQDKLLFGYWAVPLKAQPIRYILELAQYPYEEKFYYVDNVSEWFVNDKDNLGLDFPNLPYLIHKELKLTETQNITNYVVELTQQEALEGKGKDKYEIDNIRYLCDDLVIKVYLANKKNKEEKQSELEKSILPQFAQLQKKLGNKVFYFNDKLSLADIFAYSTIFYFKAIFPEQYNAFSKEFEPFLAHFEAIPSIKEYHTSPRYPRIAPPPPSSS